MTKSPMKLMLRAWNKAKIGIASCRAAMLQGADRKPELAVWYGAMPETNGKTNWTAMLHRKGQHPWEGITIDRSEYPDRVRYEADRMRHLIGDLADEPDILAYDADAHSGYVKPGNSPVTPNGWIPVSERMPPQGVPLLVCSGNGVVQRTVYGFDGENWLDWYEQYDPVKAELDDLWLPLPAPPQ
ncbi:TPA: DUF551 domain-containing protein [Citrobacter braakii]